MEFSMAGSWQSTQEVLIEIADFLAATYGNASAIATDLEAVVREQRVVVRHLEEIVDAFKAKSGHDRTGEVEKKNALPTEEEQLELERLDEVLEQARRLREISLKPTVKKKPPNPEASRRIQHATPSAKQQNPSWKKSPLQRVECGQHRHQPSLQPPKLPDDFLKLMAEHQQRCAADTTAEDCELQQSKSQFLSDLSKGSGVDDPGCDKTDDWAKGAAVIESIVRLLKVQMNISEGGGLEMDPADIIALWRDVSSAAKELDQPPPEVHPSDVDRWRNRALRMLLSNPNGQGTVSDKQEIPEEMSTVWLPDECWKLLQNSDRIESLIRCGTKPVMTYTKGAQLEKLQESREALQRLLFDTYLQSQLAPKLIAAANSQNFSEERRAALCKLAHRFLGGKKNCVILRPTVGDSERVQSG